MRLLFLLYLACLAACSRSSNAPLPDVALPTLAGNDAPTLASCPTVKCLTVYVAPWCGYCRAATPMIIALRDFLKDHNILTRVVVGMDKAPAVRDYAKVFGPDTILDPGGELRIGGVPHFFVSDHSGAVVKEVAGVPMGVDDVAQFASFFDLP